MSIQKFLTAPRQPPPLPAPLSRGREDVLQEVFHGFETWGAESIEIEFRLGKISPQMYRAILKKLTDCPTIHQVPAQPKTREEFNGTDARLVQDVLEGGTLANPRTVYKKKLVTQDLPGGIRLQVCLERPGPHQGDDAPPRTIYRIKDRQSFTFGGVWRFDLTTVETNDPRYSDSDDLLYEAEIELLSNSDAMYYYTVDHLLQWGQMLALELQS